MKCPYCCGTGKCEPTLAARVRAARNDIGLTQEQVADGLKISRAQLANMEAGRTKASLPVLIALADLYGKSLDWLVGRETSGGGNG